MNSAAGVVVAENTRCLCAQMQTPFTALPESKPSSAPLAASALFSTTAPASSFISEDLQFGYRSGASPDQKYSSCSTLT